MVVSAWPGWPRFLGKLHQFLALASPGQPGQCHKLYCTPNFTFSANKFLARIDLPVLTLASHGLSRPCRPFVFLLFLSNFWPRPTLARPGQAGPVAAAPSVFLSPGLPRSGRVPDAIFFFQNAVQNWGACYTRARIIHG